MCRSHAGAGRQWYKLWGYMDTQPWITRVTTLARVEESLSPGREHWGNQGDSGSEVGVSLLQC